MDGRPIEVAFFDSHLTDDRGQLVVTPADIDEWHKLGRFAGLRFGPNWYGWPEPSFCALIFSNEIARLEADGKHRIDVVEYDIEPAHNTPEETAFYRDWQVRFLLGYQRPDGTWAKGIRGAGGFYPDSKRPQTRGYRWGRPFIYTVEGRQTLTQIAGDVVAKCGGKFGVQAYNGGMTEVWDDQREFLTWVRSGIIPTALWTPYADAARAHRPLGVIERVLFATSRLTELYE